MKVVSVINHKGGVGKTTLTANLGAGLAARGHKVLLIDLDAQASLTVSFFREDEWLDGMKAKSIKHWFDDLNGESALTGMSSLISTPPRVMPMLASQGGYLDLIAAHRDLGDVDVDLAIHARDGDGYLAAHSRLRAGLAGSDIAEYDIVLLDCAPQFGMLSRNAVLASDFLLIPTKPDYLSTTGVHSLGEKVTGAVKQYNERLMGGRSRARTAPVQRPHMAVVFTMVQIYSGQPIASQQTYISRVAEIGAPTFETYVKESKAVYGPSPEYGIPVILGGSSRALTRELRDLVTELNTHLEGVPS